MPKQTKKTKVIYFVTISEFGGAQKYIYELASELSQRDGFEVIVAAGTFNGDLFKKLAEKNVPFRALKYLKRDINPFWDIFAFFEIWSFLRKEKPDVVHLNSSKISILGSVAAKLAGVQKIIYTAHGWAFNETISTFKKDFYLFAEKHTAKMKTHIITVSDHDLFTAKAKNIAPRGQLLTIHNGIRCGDIVLVNRKAAKKFFSEKIKHPAFDKARLIMGTIAYFYKNKGLDILIEAAKILNDANELERRGAVFLIVGKGDEEPLLRKLIKQYRLQDRVFLPGEVQGCGKYLRAFDIFTITSRKEGFPFNALEAGCAGVPILSTKVGGMSELIDHNETGLLVARGDLKAIASSLLTLLDNPALRNHLAINMSESVEDHYSLEGMLNKTIALY